ncbi:MULTISPECIES: TetR/AcrR family transcriptional regulator [Streptomyces]|uniref:TetR family transcriptional regulator n=1 Tax=Streptomyces lasiicapitis TaxID=1923961 RepID=A0ABQ2M4X8_9ACTN|nr:MULTISPECIES: TetR/AcrR family transcriptional regulator [Streptomyces]QIB45148.1 TetR/AcrR family transcriptional regulator [Streptomyces aureoverticillatus]GGO47225.1 TetR family transcriptional regulator [Streptomyces lasiicapitis]
MTAQHTGGSGDARRALELLWGAEPRPRRGPKRGLSVQRVVSRAVELADEHGLESLTMRRVAESFGVTAMSLYSYVPSKDELVDLMVDRVAEPSAEPGPPGEHWRAGLERHARTSWRIYHRHPWVLEVSMGRPPLGPNVLAGLEARLTTVGGLGLSVEQQLAVINLVDDYVHGAATSLTGVALLERRTGLSAAQWWERYDPLLEEFVDFERYPALTAMWEELGPTEQRTDFEFGLQRVLDGVSTFVESSRETGT